MIIQSYPPAIVTDLKVLREKSSTVTLEQAEETIKILEDTFNKLSNTHKLGLSAIQIGRHEQVAIIRMPGEDLNLINPKILDRQEKILFSEACLSLPGLGIVTDRYHQITLDNNGQILELTGLKAVAVQHEVDHMNGLTILDRKHRKKR